MNEYALEGCRITPISNYLKALGLFRILFKEDPKITACWKKDNFVIATEMSRERIMGFLLNEYYPTTIISPWSYDKFEKTRDKLQELLELDRFRPYKETIHHVDDIVIPKFCSIHKIEKLCKKDITKTRKHSLLQLCRNHLPDDVIPWLDAVFVLEAHKPVFAPILGTGANDGNFDMAENFVKCMCKIFTSGRKTNTESKEWLELSLFGGTAKLDKRTKTGHDPDGSGGPNSGMGFGGKSLSNPWDYVLMMEGVMLFAGNLSKHLPSSALGKSVFPFTADASNVGYPTASATDGNDTSASATDGNDTSASATDGNDKNASGGELWLPIWENHAAYQEIQHVFNEGRVQLGGKYARTGTEFARAIVTLGTERGISSFQRFCVLKRKGRAYLFTDAGMVRVADEPIAHLLGELDEWYNQIKKIKNKPKSLLHMIKNFDESIMKFCKYRKKQNMLQVLMTMGILERYVCGHGGAPPLQKLSVGWLVECYDHSAEFRLAASLASIKSVNEVGSIRENLESATQKTNVLPRGHRRVRGQGENLESATQKTNVWKRSKDSIQFVWKEDDNLLRNMSRILQRRGMDGKIQSHTSIPIKGIIPAKINDIAMFLNGDLDTKKISDLMLPLSIIDITGETRYPWEKDLREDNSLPLPEAYMIMKLIYPKDDKESIPYDLSVLNMLFAGLVDHAYAKTSHILYAHGLLPLRHSKKTGNAKSTSVSNVVKEHLTASLLFPISKKDRNLMLKSVTAQSSRQWSL